MENKRWKEKKGRRKEEHEEARGHRRGHSSIEHMHTLNTDLPVLQSQGEKTNGEEEMESERGKEKKRHQEAIRVLSTCII